MPTSVLIVCTLDADTPITATRSTPTMRASCARTLKLGSFFDNVRIHFKKALRRAYDLPKDKDTWTEAHKKTYAIRFPDLRHSSGSLMLLSGASIADVKEILGHSSIAITAAIYLHSYEETKRAAVAGAAKLLRAGV